MAGYYHDYRYPRYCSTSAFNAFTTFNDSPLSYNKLSTAFSFFFSSFYCRYCYPQSTQILVCLTTSQTLIMDLTPPSTHHPPPKPHAEMVAVRTTTDRGMIGGRFRQRVSCSTSSCHKLLDTNNILESRNRLRCRNHFPCKSSFAGCFATWNHARVWRVTHDSKEWRENPRNAVRYRGYTIQ